MTEKEAPKKLTYSVPEVALALGISKPKAYDLVNRCDFPKIRVGRKIVVPIQEFEHWVSAHAYDNAEDWIEEVSPCTVQNLK